MSLCRQVHGGMALQRLRLQGLGFRANNPNQQVADHATELPHVEVTVIISFLRSRRWRQLPVFAQKNIAPW